MQSLAIASYVDIDNVGTVQSALNKKYDYSECTTVKN